MDNADDWAYKLTTLFLERLMDSCPPPESKRHAIWTRSAHCPNRHLISKGEGRVNGNRAMGESRPPSGRSLFFPEAPSTLKC
jgi:hypothetical protein